MIIIKQYDFYYKLRTLPFIEQLWLFGSRSKGTEAKRSDIDLAIVCPTATAAEWQKILSILENADTLLKVDCIRFDQLQDEPLKREIEASKTVLFERVKNHYPWYETFLDLKEALDQFKQVLTYDKDAFPYIIEATIQVFKYTFELYWKLLKKICRQEGIEVNSPRSTLQQAYTLNLIDNEHVWLEMVEDRNLTSHTYKHSTASAIYHHCQRYLPLMDATYERLKQRFSL